MELLIIGIAILFAITITALFVFSEIKSREELRARSRQAITKESSLNRQVTQECPFCRKPVTWSNACFCSACGMDLNPQCSQCNIPLRTGDSFCYKCGSSIARNTPPLIAQPMTSYASTTIETLSKCSYCNAARTTQDTFCGSCGKSFALIVTDQTIQREKGGFP